MELTSEAIKTLVEWAKKECPAEACGLITRCLLSLRVNDATAPDQEFAVSERSKLDLLSTAPFAPDLDGVAIWHSHPTTRAFPSPQDVALMRLTRAPMVIVSLLPTVPEVCVFMLDPHNPSRFRKVGDYRTC